VKAIALNNLKPVYVVTDKGTLYAKAKEFNPQFQVDVQQEIIKAVDKVMKYPQHNQ
ncbi:MAG: late competence development ComFB family protein, partial [Alkalibacterium sp.]|nr:late competence development ComFB family protein [Alkalibacterium sp.]